MRAARAVIAGGGLPALTRMIDLLSELAVAPRDKWRDVLNRLEVTSPIAMREAGTVAMLVAAQAKRLAKNLPHANADAEIELRGVMRALANVLMIERNAHAAPKKSLPYYTRD